MQESAGFSLPPADHHNRVLVSNAHPSGWQNPKPRGRYNLVVIGGGTSGLVSAAGAAALGAKVALVERYLLGGDCLNMGCVPSKAIIRSARSAQDCRDAHRFGIRISGEIGVDFAAVMERMRELRSRISFHDSAERFRELGVEVYLGEARFAGRDSVMVGGDLLRFSRAVIATGARAVHPVLEGLAEAGYYTNETIFSLTERPERLAVIGGGPIGSELAQAFHRLGSEVTVFQRTSQLLGREDEDATRIVQDIFIREGIGLLLNSKPKKVIPDGGEKLIIYEQDGKEKSISVDAILVGAGRAPNVEGLNLDAAGVRYDSKTGIFTDDFLRTANPRIYAAGDVCLQLKFTHMADASARIAIRNCLFSGRGKVSALTVPRVTYTDPEIAHVGLSEKEAEQRGMPADTFLRPMTEVDRAVLDGETEGFVKIRVRRGSDTILGATIVARHAGEMINEISLAMVRGLGLKSISKVIHPYPTQAEAIRQTADIYYRGQLTPLVRTITSLWLRTARSGVVLALGNYLGCAARFFYRIINGEDKK